MQDPLVNKVLRVEFKIGLPPTEVPEHMGRETGGCQPFRTREHRTQGEGPEVPVRPRFGSHWALLSRSFCVCKKRRTTETQVTVFQ